MDQQSRRCLSGSFISGSHEAIIMELVMAVVSTSRIHWGSACCQFHVFLGSIKFLESFMAKITVSGWLSTRCLPQFLTVCWLETTPSSLLFGPPHHDHFFYPSQQGGKTPGQTNATVSCNTILMIVILCCIL